MTRYGLTAVLAVIGILIAPRAFANGRLYSVVLVATIISTRVIVVAPRRFEMRRTTPGSRWLWYVLLAEIGLLAVAFALALEPRGSVPVAWATLFVAAAVEVFASRWEPREHIRAGTLVPWIEYEPDELQKFVGESSGPANEALKSALTDAYADIPTVARAYLATATANDGKERRVLALRFSFPWIDEDAVVAAQFIFRRMFAPSDSLEIYPLDEAAERRVRAAAAPFYERAAADS